MTYEQFIEQQLPLIVGDFPNFSEEKIANEIDKARNAINLRRRFTPTEDIPVEPQYYHVLIQLTIEALSKIGAEGQTSHSENGVGRVYDNASLYSQSTLGMIVPKVKSL